MGVRVFSLYRFILGVEVPKRWNSPSQGDFSLKKIRYLRHPCRVQDTHIAIFEIIVTYLPSNKFLKNVQKVELNISLALLVQASGNEVLKLFNQTII